MKGTSENTWPQWSVASLNEVKALKEQGDYITAYTFEDIYDLHLGLKAM